MGQNSFVNPEHGKDNNQRQTFPEIENNRKQNKQNDLNRYYFDIIMY